MGYFSQDCLRAALYCCRSSQYTFPILDFSCPVFQTQFAFFHVTHDFFLYFFSLGNPVNVNFQFLPYKFYIVASFTTTFAYLTLQSERNVILKNLLRSQFNDYIRKLFFLQQIRIVQRSGNLM